MPAPTCRPVLLSLTAAALLVSAAPASAGTVEFETPAHVPTEVVFLDEAGEANSVSVTQTAGEIVVRDSSAPISTGDGCTQRTANEAVCPLALSVRLVLGDGNDSARLTGVRGYASLYGGPGDDVLRGTGTSDNLHGGGGQDQLHGRGGNDRLEDEDVSSAEGKAGSDTIVGGAGNDTADYRDRGPGQSVLIDLARERGAGDTIRGIETVRTGPADDTIAGDDAVNYLYGGGGLDTLVGRGGADELTVEGGALARGDGGDDWIFVKRGGAPNRIDCGRGHDHVASHTADLLSPNCEHARAGRVDLSLEGLRGTKRTVRRHGALRFRVECISGERDRCAGRLRLLRSDGSVASTAGYRVAGRRSYVSFRLGAADRRRAARGEVFSFAAPTAGAPGFRMFVRTRGGRP
ncbi:MAG: hypothetical protein QOJ22_278 [Thermoleophilaceae bacterium]|jgi:hypothetical protein|nr:hypothetical protein [Thermoleophilaceae bacterium]